jgi:anti-anti-sigma factor
VTDRPHSRLLDVRAAGGATVARFPGPRVSLDEATAGRFADALDALADAGRGEVLLDLGNVDFLSCRALGLFVALHRRLHAAGGRLALCNVGPRLYEAFEVAGLHRVLDVRMAGVDAPPREPAGILVVDDAAAVRGLLARWLRGCGFAVWAAATGAEALEVYRGHRAAIDLVLLDVRLPGMDGPEVLAALRQINPRVACCFMTGDPGLYTEEGLRGLGAERVFPKPLVLGPLAEALRRLIGGPTPDG